MARVTVHPLSNSDSQAQETVKRTSRWTGFELLSSTTRGIVGTVVGSLLLIAVLAEGEASNHDSTAKALDKKAAPAAQPLPSTTPSTPTTIGPSTKFDTTTETLSCSYSDRTIQAGDTIFSLTTVGLNDKSTFMDEIYEWNLKDIAKQAETDPTLQDPNHLAPGQKLKILNNCVRVSPVYPSYDFSHYDSSNPSATAISGYWRRIDYQVYSGTDGQVHNGVSVVYAANGAGDLLDVKNCEPSRECSSYVAGAP